MPLPSQYRYIIYNVSMDSVTRATPQKNRILKAYLFSWFLLQMIIRDMYTKFTHENFMLRTFRYATATKNVEWFTVDFSSIKYTKLRSKIYKLFYEVEALYF